ncbi:MAG TPA: pilus assembly protein TadG-related protein [Candidatus Limnocylindrales bacterium]
MTGDTMILHPRKVLLSGLNAVRRLAGVEPLDDETSVRTELKQAGQIVVIFALMLTVLIGLVGIAIDSTYAWRESLRVQRAADAAALAGVVYMPGNFNTGTNSATSIALKTSAKNGFPVQVGTTVSPTKVDANPRELDVTVSTKVPTFFARIFGMNSWTVTRTARAVYVLPVPMGSPDPFYGVYGKYKMNGTTANTDMKHPVTTTTTLTGRGFWATMLSQGAGASSGDAYLPKKLNSDMSGTNSMHDTVNYYDYDIVMPAGSTGGHVWLFDPVFCATDGRQGTGDFYLSGSGTTKMSSFFSLYNTNGNLYSLAGQTYLGSSGSLFANNEFTDTKAGGPTATSAMTSCTAGVTSNKSDPRYWHNQWFDLSAYIGGGATLSGGATGQTYRLRTTTDPGDSSQDSTNAYNDFSIYVTSGGTGTPMVYGQGAMEMYTPLPAGTASTFYLAKIDKDSGAGKTIEIQLWDVGDTNGLNANLQILQPTTSGWSAVTNMTWTGTKVSTDSSTCSNGGPGSSITTYNGNKLYNGCWLTIDVSIPTTYTAPQDGWWKITYNVGTASGTEWTTDLTTWQVNILGNPVHLI